MKNGYTAYRSASIDTADQGKLILIAYDVAIKHCKLAMSIFEDTKQIEARTKYLMRAQDAVTELMGALRMDVGKISHNLYALYDYILRRLIHANARNTAEPVQEVLKYLTDLREAWAFAAEQTRKQRANSSKEAAGNENFAISG